GGTRRGLHTPAGRSGFKHGPSFTASWGRWPRRNERLSDCCRPIVLAARSRAEESVWFDLSWPTPNAGSRSRVALHPCGLGRLGGVSASGHPMHADIGGLTLG